MDYDVYVSNIKEKEVDFVAINNERAHERSQPGILNLPRQTRRANEAA
jgi:hypothetical protein